MTVLHLLSLASLEYAQDLKPAFFLLPKGFRFTSHGPRRLVNSPKASWAQSKRSTHMQKNTNPMSAPLNKITRECD